MNILPRSAWTKTPNNRPTPLSAASTTSITLHYPAVGKITLAGETQAKTASRLEGWRKMHTGQNGWRDIGYNYAVDQAGRVYFLTGLRVGAHAGTNPGNQTSVGVLLVLGDNETPTDAMIAGVRSLRAEILRTRPKAQAVKGHRDWKSTACPGQKTYDLIKAGVFTDPNWCPADLPAPVPTPTPTKPLAFWLGLANVTGVTYSDGVNLGGGWAKRGPKVAARVKALACSLYAVNEVTATAMTRTLSAGLASKFRHTGSKRGNDAWFDSQKFTLLQEREFHVPGIAQNRSVKWCELRRDGRVFNLLIPHFPNAAPDQRTVMAKYVVNLTKGWRDPIIIAGDLNNTSQGANTPRAIFAAAGFTESRKQAKTIVNGDVPEFAGGRPGAWLSDVLTKGCTVTDIRLVKVPASESTHHFFQARIEIGA